MAGEMGGLTPVLPIGGSGCHDGWGGGWGALAGGAIGGAVGSAWGRNGNWNNGGCCNSGCCGGNSINLLDNTLTTMRTDINSIGRDNLMQTASSQSAMCQGFGGVNASVERVGAAMAQAQSRTEAAVLTVGLQGQIAQKDNTIATLGAAHAAEVQGLRNTFDLKSSIDNCCCETNRNIERQGCDTRAAIHAEGEATRALIVQNTIQELRDKLCDCKSENASLKAQQFNSALAAGTVAQTQAGLNHLLSVITAHYPPRAAETGTAAAA